MTKIGARWYGHHIKKEFKLYEKIDPKEFIKFHTENAHIESFPFIEEPYQYANMDAGAWVYDAIKKNGYKMSKTNMKVALHLGAQSWANATDKEIRHKRGEYEYNLFEMELDQHPKFKEVYQKNL